MVAANSVWIVIVLAFFAANTPFLSSKFLVFWTVKFPKKLALQLFEISVLYFCVGGVGLFFEQKIGQIFFQNWEFYAITGALFLTLSFPGFVYRYLFKST